MITNPQYDWLNQEAGPRMLLEAIKLYGTSEIVGGQHNRTILAWAKEVEIEHLYRDDEMPWCGLAMAVCAHRAGKALPMTGWDILRALEWTRFGSKTPVAMLGDIVIFRRSGGGHVGMYVGEDDDCYHVLGGNQGNQFNIIRMERSRLHAIRRPHYNNQPPQVRRIRLLPKGTISKNEA
jgi:uncharacterized protein (TIGR02594 family)